MDIETTTPKMTERFLEAVTFAAHNHREQIRKGTTVPYLSHLLSVCGLVLESGGDEDLAIAALLHDAVEDAKDMTGQEISALIRSKFGARVADIVDGCSDTISTGDEIKPPWKERKTAYIAKLRNEPVDVLKVSIADKVHNARSIASDHDRDGDEVWKKFKSNKEENRWYYTSLHEVYAERIPESILLPELELAIQRIWSEIPACNGNSAI